MSSIPDPAATCATPTRLAIIAPFQKLSPAAQDVLVAIYRRMPSGLEPMSIGADERRSLRPLEAAGHIYLNTLHRYVLQPDRVEAFKTWMKSRGCPA